MNVSLSSFEFGLNHGYDIYRPGCTLPLGAFRSFVALAHL